MLFLFIAIALLFIAAFIDTDATSFFQLYRDRLQKAFLFDPDPKHRKGTNLKQYDPNLHDIDTDHCPYPIINAAINLEGSQFANKRGRNADFFIFTPEYTGSQATGYVGSKRLWNDDMMLDLATAMAISGAAVSANMGAGTIRLLTPTLALLNVRLGKWLRNPLEYDSNEKARKSKSLWSKATASVTFFKEMFGLLDESEDKVYLTDGGHIENLGLFELLRRHCKFIIAIDAEADPMLRFPSLMTLMRFARTDLGVRIVLPWQELQASALEIDDAFAQQVAEGKTAATTKRPQNAEAVQCAACEIEYPENEKGYLLYFKSSLRGDENDVICDYKRRHLDFPHETTIDQFFGEQQLEAYRGLGFRMVLSVLEGSAPFAVRPRGVETVELARARIRRGFLEALEGRKL